MKKYVIIDAEEVSSVNFSQVCETSEGTLRYSTDGTKTFVKFEGDTIPSFLSGKTQLSADEIRVILNDPSGIWTAELPF